MFIIHILSLIIHLPTLSLNIPSIIVARLLNSTSFKAFINRFHVALPDFLNHNWNISLQHLPTSLGLLLSISFNFSSSSCSSNSRPKSCHLEETSFRTYLFNSFKDGRSSPICMYMCDHISTINSPAFTGHTVFKSLLTTWLTNTFLMWLSQLEITGICMNCKLGIPISVQYQ